MGFGKSCLLVVLPMVIGCGGRVALDADRAFPSTGGNVASTAEVFTGGNAGSIAGAPSTTRIPATGGNAATGGSTNMGNSASGGTRVDESHTVATGGRPSVGGGTGSGGVPSSAVNGTGGWVSMDAGASGGASGVTCQHDGVSYRVGDEYWDVHVDVCTLCTCGPYGIAYCSSDPCEVCRYQPFPVFAGETVPAQDGCNTCTCFRGGPLIGRAKMFCSEKDCSAERDNP